MKMPKNGRFMLAFFLFLIAVIIVLLVLILAQALT